MNGETPITVLFLTWKDGGRSALARLIPIIYWLRRAESPGKLYGQAREMFMESDWVG